MSFWGGENLIKIVGGGLTGLEVAYICANCGFRVHIFNKHQTSPTYNYVKSPFEKIMEEELNVWASPSYLLSSRLGVKSENADESFLDLMRSKVESLPNVEFIDAEIDELNPKEVTLISIGNNPSVSFIKNLEKLIGENRVQYFHPKELCVQGVNKENLVHDSAENFHINLSREEYEKLKNLLSTFSQNYDNSTLIKEISAESLSKNDALRTAVLRPLYSPNERAYASIKLKKEGENFYFTDFFTALSNEEQDEIISNISAFNGAKISEYGKIYKKIFLTSSSCLNEFLQIKNYENIFVCGGFLGLGGVLENLLVANYIAYNLMNMASGKNLQNLSNFTCTSKIIQNLLQKSVLNHRLLSLNYDIINRKDSENLNPNAVLKFKEKFYGNCF